MNLTEQILHIILPMQIAFSQQRSFRKLLSIIFAILCTVGRHTITSFIYFAKQEKNDWTRIYRFFSKSKWDPDICFDELAKTTLKRCLKKHSDIVVAIDDFRIMKTGKKIPYTRFQLDPKSPPFHPNLMWGHRYLHATLLIARKKRGRWQAAKSITIRIKLAPHMQKPGKKATEEERQEYEKSKRDNNLNIIASELIKKMRQSFDEWGYENKPLIVVADGGYCNKTILRNLPERVDLIVRCRKDAKLCYRTSKGKKFYDENKFTPQELYKDPTIVSNKAQIFYGRRITQMKYKERLGVYWQRGSQRCPLKAIVIFGVKYRRNKNGHSKDREPMYLLTTNLKMKTNLLIQYYIYRWEIEVTHRELKNDLGVCQAQVWNEVSVEKCPKVVALANSIIHLAYILLEESDDKKYLEPPKWYKKRKRISLEYLRKRLRKELAESLIIQEFLDLELSWKDMFEKKVA